MSRAYTAISAFITAIPFLLVLTGAQLPSQTFQPPEGTLAAGLRETERHREPIPELRIARNQGDKVTVTFWVHVDPTGRVLELRDFRADASYLVTYSTEAVVEALRKVTYRPFLVDGVAAEAWVQDQVQIGAQSEPPPSPAAGNFPTLEEPMGFSIRLSRSGCFGTCPIYSVVIYGDGKIEYHGKEYVAISGDHEARIEPEAATRLLERFRSANFFALKDEYVAAVTDNPTYRLELAIGQQKKTVTDYVGTWVGMPSSVRELEDAVDGAAGADRWVGTGPQTVEAMQEAGIAPNSKRAEEVLDYAVRDGKVEAVRSLLAAGVPVSRPNHSGGLLAIASLIRDRHRQFEVLEALLENIEVRADKTGMQDVLGRAVDDGNVEVARILIDAGADPAQLFHDTYEPNGKADQTYLMRAAESGVWEMLDDALSRPHDIHAIDRQGRSALAHVVWTGPPMEDIFPMIDRLLAAGANKKELTRALVDACDPPQWREGLVKRGADPSVCASKK